MWVCTNKGFISAVQSEKEKGVLKVRARNKKHLSELFPSKEIHEDRYADYRYRVFVPQAEFAEWAKKQAEAIDYGNFKDSVKDHDLHDLYADFWSLHWHYQKRLHPVNKVVKDHLPITFGKKTGAIKPREAK